MRRDGRVRGLRLKSYEGIWDYRSFAGIPTNYTWPTGKVENRQHSPFGRDRPYNMPLCKVKGARKKGCQDITRDTVVLDWRLEPRRGSDPNEALRIAMNLDASQELGDGESHWEEYGRGRWSGSNSSYGSYPCSDYGSDTELQALPPHDLGSGDTDMGGYDEDTGNFITDALPLLPVDTLASNMAASKGDYGSAAAEGSLEKAEQIDEGGAKEWDLSQWPQMVAAVNSLTLEAFRAAQPRGLSVVVSEDSESEVGSWVDVADGLGDALAMSESGSEAAEWQLL